MKLKMLHKCMCLLALSALLALGFSTPSQEMHAGRVADFCFDDDVVAITQASSQWHLQKIRVDQAWEITAGSPNIIVAVLDSGIDIDHEDLRGKVVDSVNFTTSRTTQDVYGHGTLIAGLIAASVENLTGTTGVAYSSSLLNVKVADDAGYTEPIAVANGITWAADNGANIINLSVVLTKPSKIVEEAVKYAWDKGCVVVAASGNNSGLRPMYPAAYQNVISVAATDLNDRLPRWSNRGDWVTVSAPGVDIYSTLPDDRYAERSGTSFATALVSGEAALLYAIARDTNDNGHINDEIRDAVQNQTDIIFDASGKGRVNALKAAETFIEKP